MTQSNKFEITGEDVTLVKDEGILKQILREGSGDEKPFKVCLKAKILSIFKMIKIFFF
jgi:hypothetical protein